MLLSELIEKLQECLASTTDGPVEINAVDAQDDALKIVAVVCTEKNFILVGR